MDSICVVAARRTRPARGDVAARQDEVPAAGVITTASSCSGTRTQCSEGGGGALLVHEGELRVTRVGVRARVRVVRGGTYDTKRLANGLLCGTLMSFAAE